MSNEYDQVVGGIEESENEYDSIINEFDAPNKTAVRVSLKASEGRTPEQQAEIIDLSSRSKIPADVVGRNIDQVRAKVEANEYDQIIQDSPELAGWMSNPENAALSRDDVGSLSKINSALKAFIKISPIGPVVGALETEQGQGFRESLSRIPQTITKTLLSDPIVELTDEAARPRKSVGGVSDSGYTDPVTGEFKDTGIPSNSRYSPAAPSFAKELNTIARGINESLKVDADASAAGLPESVQEQRNTRGLNTAKILDNLGQIPAYAIAMFSPGKAIEGGLAGIKTLTQAERAVLAGAATNSAIIGSQTYNDAYQAAYDNYIALGAHPEEAAYKAQYQAQKAARTMRVIAAVTGAFGEGEALATTSLKEIPKAFVKGAASEVPEEIAQSALTKAAAGQKLNPDEIVEIAALAAILGGGVNTAMTTVNVQTERQRNRATNTIQAQQSIDEIATAAQQSKLLQRSPEKFKEGVRELGQKSGQDAVYIPVEALTAYYQSKGIDPGAEVAKLTGQTEAYQEALETGADIKIPIENFAADIAPLHYEGLKDHIRTSPDAMTPTEAAEYEKNQDEIAAGFVDTTEETDTSPQVYDAVLAELIDAGIETKAAEKQAKLYSSVFRSLGQRTGLDPVTLYNRYGLTVSRADLPTIERRTQTDLRAEFENLPKEEQFRIAYSDPLTGLLNKRAFNGLPKKRFRIAYDGDSLGWVNDHAGHAAGDTFLKEVAKALNEQHGSQDAFRTGGDEFWGQADTLEEAQAKAAAAREYLKNVTIRVTNPGEEPFLIKGIGLSFGIGETDEAADSQLLADKQRREASGERAPKTKAPPGVTYLGAGNTAQSDQAGGDPGNPQTLAQAGDTTLNQAPADAGVSVSGQAIDLRGTDATLDRIRPKNAMMFQKPYTGKSGAQLVGYEWKWRAEDIVDSRGEDKTIRVSDWEQSIINPITNREIVHQFYIKNTDGKTELVSAETAAKMLGVSVSTARSSAKKLLQAEIDKAKKEEQAKTKIAEINAKEWHDTPAKAIESLTGHLKDIWAKKSDWGKSPNAMYASKETVPMIVNSEGRYQFGTIMSTEADAFKASGITENQVKLSDIWDRDGNSVVTLNQPPPPLDGAQRGMITFNDQRTRFSILLFKNADMSTLPHESGHFYFEVLGDLVRRGEASQQIMDDYQIALNWMGVKDAAELSAITAERQEISRRIAAEKREPTEQEHKRIEELDAPLERFARGFEAYLMEGKAPSVELQGVFARFRAWFTQIYRTVKNLDVELSDEIRAVFDRLVATEDEITAAEQEQDYRVVFGDNPVLQKIAAEAREAAETKLANQAMKEIARQEKATWKENRKRVMGEVAAKVNSRPVYQVLAYLGKGTLPDGSPLPPGMEPVKLSKKALLTKYKQDWIVSNLYKKKVYTNDGGVDPELLAPVYGFPSGDAMVQAMVAAEPREDVIARETDEEMKRQYGDMMTDGTMRQKAMEAVHNSKREELMLAELRAIKRKLREAEPLLRQSERDDRQARLEAKSILPSQKELRFIKASAEQLMGQKKVRDINPNLYRVAEARAGRIAFEAAAKGDYEKAYNAKLQQIRNHALYRAATKAKADSEKIVRFLKRFQKKGLRTKLGKVDRLEQVDMLLDRYDLRKQSNKAIDIGKAKLELLTQIQSGLLSAPKSFTDSLRGNDKVNYRDETIESLRGLRDVLTQIRTEALGEFEAMVNGEKIILDDAADQMADTVSTNGKSVIPTYGELSAEERMREFGKSLINSWLRTPTLARLLDNDQRGAWTRYVIEPVRKAVTEKLEPMKDKAQKDLAKLYNSHYSVKEMVKNNERSVVPGINLSLSRWDLISLALNWGNAENRKAVLESTVAERKPFTEQGVLRAFRTLDKRDWDFVQAVWSYVDSYWPEIKESQRRRRGITPPKVEADPFTVMTKDGQTLNLAGGYYPLKYNPRLDAKSRQHEIDDAFEKMRVGTMSSTQTKHGHVQERVGSGGQPVMLSMNVLHSHINNVIMDIALGDAVIYVDKLLRRPQIKQSLIDTDNLDALESFKLWLKDVATGELAPRSGGEQAAKFIRLGFAKSKIGFNLVTTALQVTGLPQTMVVTGKQNFAKGAKEYAKNPRAAIRQVMSQSKLMHSRYELNAYNKEVQGVYEALGRKGAPASTASSKFARAFLTAFNAIQIPPWLIHIAFLGMKYSQLQVDMVTWLAGYEQAKARDLPHNEAVLFADSVVENAQTSGMWNDRAPIERGTLSANTRQNEYVKLLTTLASYMIAKGNIAVEKYQATDFKNIGQALGFFGDVMLLFSVEAILGAALRGQWPDDDDDWWWWAAKQTSTSAISTIPVAREFPGAMDGFSTGGPLGSFMADIGKAANQTLQGEIDLALIKAYSNVLGTTTGYPSAQINRMVDAYWRESEGQDVSPIEYVVGRRN